MTRERYAAILLEEAVPTTDRWLVWAAELWAHREQSTGWMEVAEPEGDEAGLRALLRVKKRKGLDHMVEGEDILAEVEADHALLAAIQ